MRNDFYPYISILHLFLDLRCVRVKMFTDKLGIMYNMCVKTDSCLSRWFFLDRELFKKEPIPCWVTRQYRTVHAPLKRSSALRSLNGGQDTPLDTSPGDLSTETWEINMVRDSMSDEVIFTRRQKGVWYLGRTEAELVVNDKLLIML